MSESSEALHQLRSALAATQAECELLEMDGTNVTGLQRALSESFRRLVRVEVLEQEQAADERSARVVLLEDDERVGAAIVRRLMRQGYDACLVLSVPMALRWIDSNATLVADLTALEEATPIEQVALRRHRPIVLTGAVAPEASRRSAPFLPRALLGKPLNVGDLDVILRDHRA